MSNRVDQAALRAFYESKESRKAFGETSVLGRMREEAVSKGENEVSEAVRNNPGLLLEIGPGPGASAKKWKEAGHEVIVLDLSHFLLRTLSDRFRAVQGTGSILPFRNGMFRFVFCDSVLMHLDLESAVRECRRILAPGGQLVIVEPLSGNPWMSLWRRFDTTYGRIASWHSLEAVEEQLRRQFSSVRTELFYANPPLALLPNRLRGILKLDQAILKLKPSLAWMGVFVART